MAWTARPWVRKVQSAVRRVRRRSWKPHMAREAAWSRQLPSEDRHYREAACSRKLPSPVVARGHRRWQVPGGKYETRAKYKAGVLGKRQWAE